MGFTCRGDNLDHANRKWICVRWGPRFERLTALRIPYRQLIMSIVPHSAFKALQVWFSFRSIGPISAARFVWFLQLHLHRSPRVFTCYQNSNFGWYSAGLPSLEHLCAPFRSKYAINISDLAPSGPKYSVCPPDWRSTRSSKNPNNTADGWWSVHRIIWPESHNFCNYHMILNAPWLSKPFVSTCVLWTSVPDVGS